VTQPQHDVLPTRFPKRGLIREPRGVLAVIVGLLITLAVALGVMFIVAFPYLRSGSRILTPDGERVVERAKEQARQKPAAAAGSTWNGLISLQHRMARAWKPVSERLHEALDRLEGRDRARDSSVQTGHSPDAQHGGAPQRHVAGPSRTVAVPAREHVEPAASHPAIGRPRPIPAISGPIPEIGDDGAGGGGEVAATRLEQGDSRVIDLRPAADVDHQAGSARHAR
jgi:hypothetical protein